MSPAGAAAVAIGERCFSEADQGAFARWSGDRNPMHIDAAAARRLAAGAPVVHGVHAALWALDGVAAVQPELLDEGCRVTADFRKFILVGQRVSLAALPAAGTARRFELTTDHGIAAAIKIEPAGGGAASGSGDLSSLPSMALGAAPADPTLDEMRAAAAWLAPPDKEGLAQAFPSLVHRFSEEAVASIAQLSSVVGMACPGLHSIFTRAALTLLRDGGGRPGIGFAAEKVDERYRVVKLRFAGPGLAGTAEAFIRPEPVDPPSMADIAATVPPGAFSGRRALVVGGSRGLGAVTAKMIAAGSGNVVLTYSSGAGEAEAIREEIAAAPGAGRCETRRLDVTEPVEPQLGGLELQPTHVYYYATPRIFLQKRPAFDAAVLHTFLRFYVEAFEELCRWTAGRSAAPAWILYPSSTAVSSRPAGLTEYAMAKAAGELLCEDLVKLYPSLTIHAPRLPRILTDQTATVSIVAAETAADVVADLLRH